jgi:hypothetical protein
MIVIVNNNFDKIVLEEFMSKLTDSIEALTSGVNAQGEALSGALVRIQEDFTAIRAKLDAALADDAEASAAADRIQENLERMGQSTEALLSLDPDPENPVVPTSSVDTPPVDTPPVDTPPVG